MTKTKFIINTIVGIATLAFFILSIEVGFSNHEKKECLRWREQAETYPNFYLTDWQKQQCEAHGIEIKIKSTVKRVITVAAIIYAYSSEVAQTDSDPYTMASGKRVYKGAIACPSKYPFGTEVEYQDIIYICEDRMAERYRDGNYFDIWMETKEEAVSWGKKQGLINIYLTQ